MKRIPKIMMAALWLTATLAQAGTHTAASPAFTVDTRDYILTVNSTGVSGVPVTVSPPDLDGKTAANSPATFRFAYKADVSVDVAATHNGASFSSWSGDFVGQNGVRAEVRMEGNRTITAAMTVTGDQEPVATLSWTDETRVLELGAVNTDPASTLSQIVFRVKYTDPAGQPPDRITLQLLNQPGGSAQVFPFVHHDGEPLEVGRIYWTAPMQLPLGNTYSYRIEAEDARGNIAVGEPGNWQDRPVVQMYLNISELKDSLININSIVMLDNPLGPLSRPTGSGFLIAPGYIMACYHTLEAIDPDVHVAAGKLRIHFGHNSISNDIEDATPNFRGEQISALTFTGAEYIAGSGTGNQNSTKKDWAILRIKDWNAEAASMVSAPLTKNNMDLGEEGFIVGHPTWKGYGLIPEGDETLQDLRPMAFTSVVIENNHNEFYWEVSPGGRRGNSGGPLFTQDGKVAGIMVAGSVDNFGWNGYVLKLSSIWPEIRDYIGQTVSAEDSLGAKVSISSSPVAMIPAGSELGVTVLNLPDLTPISGHNILMAVDITPDGVQFDPAATLRINNSPVQSFPADSKIFTYKNGQWIELETLYHDNGTPEDTSDDFWIAQVTGLSVFALATPSGSGIDAPLPIVFSSNRGGTWNIWRMSADGQEVQQLTSRPHAEVNPHWSPDGSRIAYLRKFSETNLEVRVMDARGENDQLVSAFTIGLNASLNGWTPEGNALLVVKRPAYSDAKLYRVDLLTGQHTLFLDPVVVSHREVYGSSFSRDGKRFAWASQVGSWSPTLEIFSAPYANGTVDTSAITQLTNDNKYDDVPRFSPDGSKILFHKSEASNGYSPPWNLYVMDANGGNPTRLTNITGSVYTQAGDWSPDGNRILYVLTDKIWISDADGGNAQQLTSGAWADVSPHWHPGGAVAPSPPGIVTQPTNQTVTAPGGASFSVSATGTAPLGYQWQRSTNNGASWSNLGGATSATYNTGATTTAMNGYRYRVVVSNSAGSVTSNAAVLQVLPESVSSGFSGAFDAGNHRKYLDWFGWYNDMHWPWIWDYEFSCWLWVVDNGPDNIWFWHHNEQRWMWTRTDWYKWVWYPGSPGLTWRSDSTAPEPGMVEVEGGTLPDIGGGVITVSDFQIGRYPVTWGEWQTVLAQAAARGYDIGARGQGSADDHPVRNVSWHDAVKWLNLRSEVEGLTPVYTRNGQPYRSGEHIPQVDNQANGYRLPTVEEWEYAARGGALSRGTLYSGGNHLDEVGWYFNNSNQTDVVIDQGRGTLPVGLKLPNELGLYDMSGNVWEWCWTRIQDSMLSNRYLRGGSWRNQAGSCRVYVSGASDPPNSRFDNIGFRAVLNSANHVSVDVAAYMNLNVAQGTSWVYRRTDNWGTYTIHSTYLGTTMKNGKQVHMRGNSENQDSMVYLSADFSTGAFWMGERFEGVDEFFADPGIPLLLSNFVPGQSYTITDNINEAEVTYERATVTVPMGTFADCWKTTLEIIGQDHTVKFWHARDVGMVKWQMLKDGQTQTEELMEVIPGP